MKRNTIAIALLALALPTLVASCSKDGNEPTEAQRSQQIAKQALTFSAEMPLPADDLDSDQDEVRTTLAGDGHQVLWTEGTDKISVFAESHPAANNEFTATEVVGNTATFQGEAPVAANYYALYPYNPSATFNLSGASFVTTLQTEQTAVLGSFADGVSLAVGTLQDASATNRQFQFRNATSLLKIQFSLDANLAGTDITQIRLLSKADALGNLPKLSGTTVVTASTGSARPSSTVSDSGLPHISLSNGGAAIQATPEDKAYYMVVPTEGTGTSFSLEFTTSDGAVITKNFSITTPFAPNNIKSIKVHLAKKLLLTNVALLDIINEKLTQKFVRETDGTVDYYKNVAQIQAATVVSAENNTALTSLKDIEYFTNLNHLYLDIMPNLTGSYAIANPKLSFLSITKTGISSIDFTGAGTATASNDYKSYSFNRNPELVSIKGVGPNIQSIGADYNPKLKTVDLSQATGLTSIAVRGSEEYSAIDVTDKPLLKALILYNTGVSAVDVSRNPRLNNLEIGGSKITSIDVTRNTELNRLHIYRNQISAPIVDLSQNVNLTDLSLSSDTGISSITMPQRSILKKISISGTNVTALDLSTGNQLEEFYAARAKLNAVPTGLSNQTGLKKLDLSHNQLTSIDVSPFTQLTKLGLSNNKLTSIDVSVLTQLTELLVGRNQISELDITNNTGIGMDIMHSHIFSCGFQTDSSGSRKSITVKMTSNQKYYYQLNSESRSTTAKVTVVVP